MPSPGSGTSPPPPPGESVALVHDYLLVLRGAERTFAAIASCWPEAPIHTLLYDPEATDGAFAGRRVETSYLQRLGVGQRGFRRLLPLFPRATEHLDLGEPQLVVSSSSAFAHGVRPPKDAIHVCYCHSPFRYAWHERDQALAEMSPRLRPVISRVLAGTRAWDREASKRVTHYITNSRLSATRILAFWGREASVVHPPVAIERFSVAAPEDYLLVVMELVRHKRVDLALAAARRAGRPIKVVGDGPEREHLQARYGSSATFLGRVDDATLAEVYSRALALVVPNVEDFGIAAVEAQASGRPVIAAGAGGALETVVDGETGLFFTPGDVEALVEAMVRTDFEAFSPERIRLHASTFSTEAFRERFVAEVRRLTFPALAEGCTAARSPARAARLKAAPHRRPAPARRDPPR